MNAWPTRQLHSLILLALLALTAGCSGLSRSPAPAYQRLSQGTLQPGDPIPLPQGPALLTVRGRIGAANQGDEIVMDLAAIESVGMVSYKVEDPFKGREVVYEGPLMSDLLAVWQVSEDAQILDILALNDYRVDVPIDLVRDYPVIFAVKADGAYMPVDDKGPAMLVFPYNEYEFERPKTDAFWVWQIKTIEVK